MKINYKTLIASILLSTLTGFLSYLTVKDNLYIYDYIKSPPLAPPAILFSIVWPILYILMGVSSYIIFTSDSPHKKDAINIYLLSLVFNFLWSPAFFNRNAFGLSLLILIILWVLVAGTIYNYLKINKTAAYLQIPYLVWLTFAAYLNIAILILN